MSIHNMAATNIKTTQATITWNTDSGQANTEDGVRYGVNPPGALTNDTGIVIISSTLSKSVTISSLAPNTGYRARGYSQVDGNDLPCGDPSCDVDFTTLDGYVENVSVSNVTTTGATISWTTSDDSTSSTSNYVNYGVGVLDQSTTPYNSVSLSKSVEITGLLPGTQYMVQAVSKIGAYTFLCSPSCSSTFTTLLPDVYIPTIPVGAIPLISEGVEGTESFGYNKR